MKRPDQSSVLAIAEPRQAAMFGHPLRSRLLLWCAGEERSLSQMKAKFGLSLSKLHYHVGQLLEVGLLVLSRTEPRGGRPIRHYRAVAQSFRVPQELMASQPSDRWAAELRRSLNDAANRSDDMAATFMADDKGDLLVRMTSQTGSPKPPPRVKELWRVVPLDAEQRIALAQEMSTLLERYTRPPRGPSAELFWIHVAFAPRRGEPAT